MTFGEYTVRIFLLCGCQQPPLLASLLVPNILLTTMIGRALSLRSPLDVTDPVTSTHAKRNSTVLLTLTFALLTAGGKASGTELQNSKFSPNVTSYKRHRPRSCDLLVSFPNRWSLPHASRNLSATLMLSFCPTSCCLILATYFVLSVFTSRTASNAESQYLHSTSQRHQHKPDADVSHSKSILPGFLRQANCTIRVPKHRLVQTILNRKRITHLLINSPINQYGYSSQTFNQLHTITSLVHRVFWLSVRKYVTGPHVTNTQLLSLWQDPMLLTHSYCHCDRTPRY